MFTINFKKYGVKNKRLTGIVNNDSNDKLRKSNALLAFQKSGG